MSISPSSDIVLDVVRAADPAAAMAAAEKLARLGGTSGSDQVAGATFDKTLARTQPSTADLGTQGALMAPSAGIQAAAPADPRMKAYKGLEALMLKNLVDTMLPKDSDGLLGGGMASDVWRSMLSDQLSTQMASKIDLGIASAAYAAHPPIDIAPGGQGVPSEARKDSETAA